MVRADLGDEEVGSDFAESSSARMDRASKRMEKVRGP